MDYNEILKIIWKAEKDAEKASALPFDERRKKLKEAALILNHLTEEYEAPAVALKIVAYSVFLWDLYC